MLVLLGSSSVEAIMTAVEISLLDQLARDAAEAGLLSPEAVESLFRERLKAQRVKELFEAMDRMSAVDDPPYMSPEEVAGEIKAMRAERRAQLSR
jgi:hypothetical protein